MTSEAGSQEVAWGAVAGGGAAATGAVPVEFAATPAGDASRSVGRVDPPPAPWALEVAALTAGSKWTSVAPDSGKTIVTYSFAEPGVSVFAYAAPSYAATLGAFAEIDRNLTRAILRNIEAVCNVAFVEVPDDAAQCGAVRYAYTQQLAAAGLSGYAFFPSAHPAGGDVWIAAPLASPQWDFYRPELILHETLHALGLKHPFESGSTLPAQENIIPNTVMSYSPVPGSMSGVMSLYPAEPMALDVAALQYLYGAAPTGAGDTVYDLSGPEFQGGFRTIWDAGGTDVLDASQLAGSVTLDLGEGGRSSIGVAVSASGTVAGRPMSTTYAQTLTIAFGALIESAVGSAGADVLIGNAQANSLRAGPGDDRIDGAAGVDRALFTGARSEYVITGGPGSMQVADTRAGRDGTDTLSGVERLAFGDGALAFDADGSAGQAFRLYQAAFGRGADPAGLGYWIGVLDGGASLKDVASGFSQSGEFALRYGSPDAAAFVTLLYANVLHRAPDPGGLAHHLATLASGADDRSQVLVNFSESPENQAVLVGAIQQGLPYTA